MDDLYLVKSVAAAYVRQLGESAVSFLADQEEISAGQGDVPSAAAWRDIGEIAARLCYRRQEAMFVPQTAAHYRKRADKLRLAAARQRSTDNCETLTMFAADFDDLAGSSKRPKGSNSPSTPPANGVPAGRSQSAALLVNRSSLPRY